MKKSLVLESAILTPPREHVFKKQKSKSDWEKYVLRSSKTLKESVWRQIDGDEKAS